MVELTISRQTDIRSNPDTDATAVTCDAVSLAVAFTGFRASAAGLEPNTPRVPPCDPPDAGLTDAGPADAGL